jgi:type 1 glutamine amidotransferase/HEAT repeat protein
MGRNSKAISVVLVCLWCVGQLASAGWAAKGPTAEEIQKIEQAAPAKATVRPGQPRKLLVINLCKGYVHSSIPYWDQALEIMGKKTGAYTTVISSDLNMLKPSNINQFDAVCFNNTTKLGLNPTDTPEMCKGLMNFLKGGKGIIGIHAAVDNFDKWKEMSHIMGGIFTAHPWRYKGTWAVKIDDPKHPLTKAFKGQGFKVKDEIYSTQAPYYNRGKQRVLMSLDMSDRNTLAQAKKPEDKDTGISWVKSVGKGRLFYCALGHNHQIVWTASILQHYLDGIQFAMGDLAADTSPIAEKAVSENGPNIESMLAKITKYDYGQSRETLSAIAKAVREAYGSPAKLKRIERGFIKFLKSDATSASKQFVCRQLSIVGTEESADTLAGMLAEPQTSDIARYALERIPGQAVDEVLRSALSKTTGKEKIGIISTLGVRGDSKSVSVLTAMVQDSNPEIAAAAVSAIGQIAGEEAIAVLEKVKNQTSGSLRQLVLDAYLRCADKLLDQGKAKAALAIYQKVYHPSEPTLIRIAALHGMAEAGGEQVSDVLIDILKGDNRQMQAVAIGLISGMPGSKITQSLIRELSGMGPLGQVQLLSALAKRGDVEALPAVIKQATSSSVEVRIAALEVIGALGNETVVSLLAKTAAVNTGEEQKAARESLYRLRGKKIDQTIINNLNRAEAKVKVELIRSIGERSIKAGATMLLKTAQDSDATVRRESFKVLSDVGGAEHLTALLDLLAKAQYSSERKAAEKTIVSILKKTENAGLGQVLAAATSVTEVKARCSLLGILGKIGDNRALSVLRKALADSNGDVKRAAILALSEWPDAGPAAELLSVAKNDAVVVRQVLALQGYIKLVSLPTKRSASQTVKLLQDGMDVAKRPEEKKAVLAVLPQFACTEALKMAQSCETDSALAAEAKLAVEKIKKALKL